MICTKCKFRKGCKAQEINECKLMEKRNREIEAFLLKLKEQATKRSELLTKIEELLGEQKAILSEIPHALSHEKMTKEDE